MSAVVKMSAIKSNIKLLPYAGFWEWDLARKAENISAGLASAFGFSGSRTWQEYEFWKTVLDSEELESFLRLRKELSARSNGDTFIISQRGFTKDRRLIPFANRLEVIERTPRGEALRVVGYVTQEQTESGSLTLGMQEVDHLAKLADQLPGAMYQYQYLSNGVSRFPYASKGISDIYELTPEEVKSDAARVFDRIHPEDLDTVIESIHASYVSLQPWEHDYRVVLPRAGQRWVRGTAQPEKLDDGSVLWHGYVADVTAKKEIEEELLRVNSSLLGILNAGSQVSIISTDLNGVITHFSKGAENLLGYMAEEVVATKTPVIFHLEEEITLRQKQLSARFGKKIEGFDVFVEMAKKGKHDTREWTYLRKDGSSFPVQLTVTAVLDAGNKACGYLAIATDISQIKKTEKALIESEERWQFALEGGGQGVWDWDLANNSFFTSASTKKMLGYNLEEIPNEPRAWEALIHPEDREGYEQALNEHLAGTTSIFTHEYRVRAKKGAYRWILDRAKVLQRNDAGNALRIIGTRSDITGLKRKEAELKKTIDIIGEQNRRLLNFAHIVSHNLRSHSGNFEMMFKLLDDADTPAEKEEMMGHIRTISEKLSETIAHLNEVVVVQTTLDLQRKKINLHNYINKTAKILTANIAAKKASVINEVPADLEVNYNAAYLESILLNLLSNAIKYSHPDRKPEVRFSTVREKGFTRLDVQDNGLGINMKLHRNKLFGMYKTFHPNKDAKGIGLFITRNQVEAMGGKIEADSEVNKGSTFRVYIK